MPRLNFIELGRGRNVERIPILYEDRAVLAIDKPAGWMLVPSTWQRTARNLQAAIESSINGGDFWARSRNLKFLRYVHRLDAETSGILLFAKSRGALDACAKLFETRAMEKIYLAVVEGVPKQNEWKCQIALAPDPRRIGSMKVDAREGKPAETAFRVLQTRAAGPKSFTLIEARPVTGRTHQIRIHLAQAGVPIVGDELYGREGESLGLRSVYLAYTDPFQRRRVEITAPRETFLHQFGFATFSQAPETAKPGGE
jgi:RluA family pseudouridine synthase